MLKKQFQTLFSYRWATTERLMERAAALDEATYFGPEGAGRASIHELFRHLILSDHYWRLAIQTGEAQHFGAHEDGDLEAMRAIFAAERSAWSDYLAGLTDEQIAGTVSLTRRSGERREEPLWRVLQHLVLHGMQHHTELAHHLTAAGQSPGDIDFIFYQGS